MPNRGGGTGNAPTWKGNGATDAGANNALVVYAGVRQATGVEAVGTGAGAVDAGVGIVNMRTGDGRDQHMCCNHHGLATKRRGGEEGEGAGRARVTAARC